MKFHSLKNNKPLVDCMEKWAIIALIFLFTFPAYHVDYDIGLDASYLWGLNWLFVNDYATLKQLIYPFGPLAFLKIPTVIGNNLLISILFYSTLKLGFLWLLFKLSEILKNTNRATTILIAFIVSFFTDIDFLLIGSVLILNFIYYKNKNIISFIVSILIAFVGLFIKVSIGISSLSIIAVSVFICLYYSKNIVLFLKQSGIVVLIGFVAGMLVFGNILLYFRFLIGTLMLSGGYGDTLSLHPANNWILLFPFIILMIIFPFIYKEKEVRIAYLMSLFPLFAAWKHSFIREDIYHYRILILFLFVFWGIISIVSTKKRFIPVIASLTILLLYANMWRVQIPGYKGIEREIVGVNNFRNILKHNDFKQTMLATSEKNISANRLSHETREMIGDGTVDVYPWDFSYIAANQLKWRPRKTLELGASTSRQASEKASENYLLQDDSPQFVLFHTPRDIHGGKFGSIDYRYILNDEPLLIYNLLNNYSIIDKNDKFLLFQRDTVSHFGDVYSDELQDYRFGEWIDVPYQADEVTRLKVFSSNTLLGKLNKFLYKETEYFIDYQFENGIVFTYRYVPGTAVEGLWCNPFIRLPNTNEPESKVVKVRLRNANSYCVRESFKAQFQHITLKPTLQNSLEVANVLFNKSVVPSKEVFVNLLQQSDNELSQLNGFSNQVEANEYSYCYKIDLDSLFRMVDVDSLLVEANVYANNSQNAGLVISTHRTAEDIYAVAYIPSGISNRSWSYSYVNRLICRDKHSSGMMKVYVYNFGNKPVYVDDFRVCIKVF
jgi:hypothetical protein